MGVELVNEILDSMKYQRYTSLDEFAILESCSKYRRKTDKNAEMWNC